MPQTKIAKSIISKVIGNLKTCIINDSVARFELAKELTYAFNVINWQLTSYSSFAKMVTTELTLSVSRAEKFRYMYKKVIFFGYTSKEIDRCLVELGWTRFVLAAMRQKRKLSCNSFIKKYKGIPQTLLHYSRVRISTDDRAYTFALPVNPADKFDGILETHGMSYGPNGRRVNVRGAMLSLIDSL